MVIDVNAPLDVTLNLPADDLDMTVRTMSYLRAERIHLIGELVQLTEQEIESFSGRKTVQEIKDTLALYGLTLGMKLDNWTSPLD
ncbi:DNA-directed RNA polymerase subunit alpha C-terminal domain-containing protein [Iodobacter fluviatilis]|uniref:RNA polymerase alpha subunit C-terminal domain-containing protein n=1 Tax=Iodobacter fluviatilis TaxID=537 RepID=A0A7G3G5P5_9NEIS|nr:DNA-directed RNA polymerase subunit alpha C-terminal domain-containing protein [Iodobacter fluviatilis]QBC42576.1 hypothetical protein C1H71_02735 [Iodobacter fluviatilis]